MPKVSVIVPVYNVEKYLSTCINSILVQSLHDIEIICVDDGSSDNSGVILDELANKDNRVKVLHRQNAGYGAAMNVGLEIANGEYIGIVESDDYILPEMYESLYDTAKLNNLDMVKADAFYWLESETYLSRIHLRHLEFWYDQVLEDLDRNLFFDFYMNIWTGIYKRSFLQENRINFHESVGASYQDNGFWFQTCIYAQRAMWLNKSFYYYRQDNPTASIKNKDKVMAMTREYEHVEKLLRERQQTQYLPYCYAIRLLRDMGTFKRIADEHKSDFCRQIYQDYQQYKAYVRSNIGLDERLRRLCRDSQTIIEKMITEKEKIKKKLDITLKIVIYGAGMHADRVFRILYNEGYAEKIICFTVTSDRKQDILASRPILFVEDAVRKYPNALYIIAVQKGTKADLAMTAKLEELKITNFFSGSDLEDNYYIL